MKIIAFDLGSTWACATNDPSEKMVLLGQDADALHFVETGARPEKLAAFSRAVWALEGQAVDLVIYERPFARGQAATRLLWGMAGILEAAAHAAGAAVLDISPAEIKKWATGNGHASKEEMLVAARRMGYTGDNEHEADAFALLKMAEATVTSDAAPSAKIILRVRSSDL